MKKIGILTHYYYSKNIGGLLQAFALAYFLNSKNYKAEQVAINFSSLTKKQNISLRLSRLAQASLKEIFFKFFSKLRYKLSSNQIKLHSNLKILNEIQTQNTLFAEFEHFIPHSQTSYTYKDIALSNKIYDIFITGSDQVWSSYLFPLHSFFCEFAASDKKCIAYAASSNSTYFKYFFARTITNGLKHISAISVREKALKRAISSFTDKKIEVVLDPTFLLSREEWLNTAAPVNLPDKKFIFCYFLGGKSTWQRKTARAYADKYGYELVHLPYIMQSIRPADNYLKGQGRCDIGPREFLTLINHAQCVFTDSFHGLAFSLNFQKPFYVFNRDDQSGPYSMNGRITDTLELFHLSDRLLTSDSTPLPETSINYKEVHTILNKRKEDSISWLLNAIKN